MEVEQEKGQEEDGQEKEQEEDGQGDRYKSWSVSSAPLGNSCVPPGQHGASKPSAASPFQVPPTMFDLLGCFYIGTYMNQSYRKTRKRKFQQYTPMMKRSLLGTNVVRTHLLCRQVII